jgi:hypothetical protein
MMGTLLLGRLGVVTMLSIWCLAVGFAYLCLREDRGIPATVASFSVPLLLVLPTPYLVPVFLITLVMTSVVMFPATKLIAEVRHTNTRRGLVLLAAGLGALAVLPTLPDTWWISFPLLAVGMFGPATGLLLVSEGAFRGHRWRTAACSIGLFVASWAVWMGRAFYYRPG